MDLFGCKSKLMNWLRKIQIQLRAFEPNATSQQLAMSDNTTSSSHPRDNKHLYSHLILALACETVQHKQIITKQTLVNSPTILNIYRDFKVRTNKPFKGLSSRLLNDAEYQYLVPLEEDSQMDVFDEDDEILDELNTSMPEMPGIEPSEKEEDPNFDFTQVLVKYHSVQINGVDFRFKSAVRSSCIIRASLAQEEDHILVSLKSGFLLLLRVFLVPKHIRDVDYEYQPSLHDENFTFKPFIVQWWNLQQRHNFPELNTSGFILKSSPSGLSAVSCSASQSFRIYKTLEQSNAGTVLQNHLNVPLEGLLVDSCFIESRSAIQTDMFLTLIFTEQRRLYINLFCWFSFYSGDGGISKSTLPLENTFKIPIFIAPLLRNSAFLFVSPNKLTFISVHDIISGHYEFQATGFRADSYPTNFYIPKSQIRSMGDCEVDEVLLSSNIGVIYSVLISKTEIESIEPIARVSDSISTFTFERISEGYELTYASANGSNKIIILSDLFEREYTCDIEGDTKLVYSKAAYQENLDNWAPIVDFQIVPSTLPGKNDFLNKDELWAITGSSSKSKLSHIKVGYYSAKQEECYPELRKVVRSWYLKFQSRLVLVCAFPFETKLLEFEGLGEEDVVEVEDAEICKEEQTVFCDIVNFLKFTDIMIDDMDYMIQVTTNSVVATNFTSSCTCITNECILFAEIIANHLFLIVEREAKTVLCKYKLEPTSTFSDSAHVIDAHIVSEMTLAFQPSMMKKCVVRGNDVLTVGAYEGLIHFYSPNEIPFTTMEKLVINDVFGNASSFVPHDLVLIKNEIFVGTAEGYLARFSQDSLIRKSFLRIGDREMRIYPSKDEDFIYIQCRGLYMLDLKNNSYPTLVQFNDLTPKAVNTLVEFPATTEFSTYKRLGLFRSNGFVMTHITTYTQPVVKQVRIPDESKKLLFLPHISVFVLLCGSRRGKLKFVDRQTYRVMEHSEVTSRRSSREEVLSKNEVALCACIWTIKRQDRETHKLLLGCSNNSNDNSSGLVKVLSVRKVRSNEVPSVSVLELSSFDHTGPVTHIQQVDDRIFFTDKQTIYFTSYEETEKRFTRVQFFKQFPSEINSMSVHGNKILICTRDDSLFQLDTSLLTDVIACYPKSFPMIGQVNLEDKVFASAKNSLIIIMDASETTLYPLKGTKIHISGITRLALANLSNPWFENSDAGNVALGVTVSGEVFILRLVEEHGKEIEELTANLNRNSAFDLSLVDHLNKLDRPFIGKLSGTGLLSLNKPYFDYAENRHDPNSKIPIVLDYDLNELATNLTKFDI